MKYQILLLLSNMQYKFIHFVQDILKNYYDLTC